LSACRPVTDTPPGSETVSPSGESTPGTAATLASPGSAGRPVRRLGQLFAPIDKTAVGQRLLLTVGHSGQAGRLPIRNMLLPGALAFGVCHAYSSWC
jgi:hypothetical protein